MHSLPKTTLLFVCATLFLYPSTHTSLKRAHVTSTRAIIARHPTRKKTLCLCYIDNVVFRRGELVLLAHKACVYIDQKKPFRPTKIIAFDVTLQQKGVTLRADHLLYDPAQKRVLADGKTRCTYHSGKRTIESSSNTVLYLLDQRVIHAHGNVHTTIKEEDEKDTRS